MAITAGVMSSAFAMMCCAGAVDSATASSFDLATTMETSVQTIVNNLLAMIAKVMPITVTLFGCCYRYHLRHHLHQTDPWQV